MWFDNLACYYTYQSISTVNRILWQEGLVKSVEYQLAADKEYQEKAEVPTNLGPPRHSKARIPTSPISRIQKCPTTLTPKACPNSVILFLCPLSFTTITMFLSGIRKGFSLQTSQTRNSFTST